MHLLLKRHIVPFLAIAALGLLVYSGTSRIPFHFDDYTYIEKNPVVKDFGYFLHPELLDRLYVGREMNTFIHFRNRMLGYLSFLLDYRAHGLSVSGYHTVNLAIHLLNASLVYMFLILVFRTPGLGKYSGGEGVRHIPLLAALIFVSHPVQTEAVTYISQRFASLAALFYLASLMGYLAYRLSEERRRQYLYYALSLLSAACAMKTRENAFTLPFMLLLTELAFLDAGARKRLLMLSPFFLASLMIPMSVIDFGKPLGEALDNAARTQMDISRHDYFVTQFRVILTYLRLMLFPVNQNLDYDYPLSRSLLDPRVLASALFLSIGAGLSVRLLFRRGALSVARLIPYGILWFLVALSVESGPISLSDVIGEHRMYLPSIGIILSLTTAAAVAMEAMGKARHARRALFLLAVALCMALSTLTYLRNRVWEGPRSLWSDVALKSPNKARGFYNLGVAYKNEGAMDEAIRYHLMALERAPGDIQALNGLGILYAAEERPDKAEEYYRRALRIRPGFTDALFNLGVLYLNEGRFDRARAQFSLTIQVDPGHRQARGFLDYLSGMRQPERPNH